MNDIQEYSDYDFHIDKIVKHKFYELDNTVAVGDRNIVSTEGIDYEKYMWLENMIKIKGNIIVGNSNNYYKISQPIKDKKNVKIEGYKW